MNRPILILVLAAFSTSESARSETVDFDSDRWTIRGAETRVAEHLGRQALYL